MGDPVIFWSSCHQLYMFHMLFSYGWPKVSYADIGVNAENQRRGHNDQRQGERPHGADPELLSGLRKGTTGPDDRDLGGVQSIWPAIDKGARLISNLRWNMPVICLDSSKCAAKWPVRQGYQLKSWYPACSWCMMSKTSISTIISYSIT
jgi:hypothetical protein